MMDRIVAVLEAGNAIFLQSHQDFFQDFVDSLI